MASPPLDLRFVTSADRLDRLPPTAAEVTVVGRSNVGKSSLLNALAHRKNLAKTSKTPGRTQLLNCFELPGGGTVVDCPGYGYAKAPQSVRQAFQPMIEGYLLGREELRMIAVLVDGEIGPTQLDVQMLDWLDHHELPYTVIATKHDKVKSRQRDKRKKELAEKCGVERSEVVWVSAHSGVNIDHLRDLFRRWLAEGSPPDNAESSSPDHYVAGMDDKLRQLLGELDAVIERTRADGRIDDDEVAQLRELIERMEEVAEAPEEKDEGVIEHLEEATVRFESKHPTIAAVIRSVVDTLTGYGM